jgi:hypothetical protein
MVATWANAAPFLYPEEQQKNKTLKGIHVHHADRKFPQLLFIGCQITMKYIQYLFIYKYWFFFFSQAVLGESTGGMLCPVG